MSFKAYRCAIIDIGANSVRMNIYDVDKITGNYEIYYSTRNMLGLAALVVDSKITDDGRISLLTTLKTFKKVADNSSCDIMESFATASLRGIQNGREIVNDIRKEVGINVRIISGELEAHYDYVAITNKFKDSLSPRGVILDMGGGSTELISYDENGVNYLTSMRIGCLALYNLYVNNGESAFPNDSERVRITNYIKMVMGSKKEVKGYGGNAYLIGGTARTIAKLHQYYSEITAPTDGYSFPAEDFDKLLELAIENSLGDGKILRDVAGDRLNSITPGIIAYHTILSFIKPEKVIISGSGVRDGFLIEYIENKLNK